MRFGKVRISNDIELNLAEDGDTAGQPIIFLHGWPDSWFTFSRVLPLLPQSLRLIAIDQRGFGDSSRPDCCYEIGDYADDVLALMDALAIERATLVGHSFGTFVARRLAIEQPQRVSGIVLIGTGLSPACPVLLEVQEAIADLEDPLSVDFVRDFQSGTAIKPLPEGFIDEVVQESMKAPARVWRDALNGLLAVDDVDQLKEIEAPVLLLWGEQDQLFQSRTDQERIAAAVRSGSLKTYPETGHCPNWEQPEAVAADIAAFLQGM
jgi:pimeloyl-ACP methyl ester carboxylesterase